MDLRAGEGACRRSPHPLALPEPEPELELLGDSGGSASRRERSRAEVVLCEQVHRYFGFQVAPGGAVTVLGDYDPKKVAVEPDWFKARADCRSRL